MSGHCRLVDLFLWFVFLSLLRMLLPLSGNIMFGHISFLQSYTAHLIGVLEPAHPLGTLLEAVLCMDLCSSELK